MRKFIVRIDACFNFEVEAESVDEAQGIAEDEFNPGDGYSHTTETLVFEEDGVTIADDDEECGQCEGTGTTDAMGHDEECPVCDGTGIIERQDA